MLSIDFATLLSLCILKLRLISCYFVHPNRPINQQSTRTKRIDFLSLRKLWDRIEQKTQASVGFDVKKFFSAAKLKPLWVHRARMDLICIVWKGILLVSSITPFFQVTDKDMVRAYCYSALTFPTQVSNRRIFLNRRWRSRVMLIIILTKSIKQSIIAVKL